MKDLCPLCNSDRIIGVWTISNICMQRCEICQTRWIFPSPSEANRSGVYDELYFRNNYESVGDKDREYFRSELIRIEEFAVKGRCLDVGSGVGNFLAEAKARGWRVSGIEPSMAACEIADSRLGGGEWRTDRDLASLAGSEERFELVTFWDVLAHLPDPGAALRNSVRLLHKSGVLVIKTPARDGAFFDHLCASTMISRSLRNSLLHLPMQGIYFDPEGLAEFIESIGLIIRSRTILDEPVSRRRSLLRKVRHPRGALYDLYHWSAAKKYPPRSAVIIAQRKECV